MKAAASEVSVKATTKEEQTTKIVLYYNWGNREICN